MPPRFRRAEPVEEHLGGGEHIGGRRGERSVADVPPHRPIVPRTPTASNGGDPIRMFTVPASIVVVMPSPTASTSDSVVRCSSSLAEWAAWHGMAHSKMLSSLPMSSGTHQR